MDMKANLGSFAAALKDKDVWVMNVVPEDGPNTLKLIYDRGLIGTVMNWYVAIGCLFSFPLLSPSKTPPSSPPSFFLYKFIVLKFAFFYCCTNLKSNVQELNDKNCCSNT